MMQSKYPGKCKDCLTPHEIGDEIAKNASGNWCKHGTQCPKVTTIPNYSPKTETRATDILQECQAFYDKFKELPDSKYESTAKIYMSRLMETRR